MKSLVIYYSRAGENYFGGTYTYISKGNTARCVEMIVELTGADVFQCEQIKPYSMIYDTCINEAKRDQRLNARPDIEFFDKNIADYDMIYICYPNYWSTLPMAMFTLLERIDFTGKKVKALCTHEGGGMGRSEEDLAVLCEGAQIGESLPIVGSEAKNAYDAIAAWVEY